MKNRGMFIVFEGGEGSGKSTMINKAYKYLTDLGLSCIKTREPGGVEISEKIRNVILDDSSTSMDGRTEALLYAAARRQHLVEKVIPALEDGAIVLCDRFVLSSLAYQGYARGIGIDEVRKINEFAIDNCSSDLTIFFDVEPEIGLERVNSGNREVNRLDKESIDFHKKVQEGYHKAINASMRNIVAIDADGSINDVWKKLEIILRHATYKDAIYNLNTYRDMFCGTYDLLDWLFTPEFVSEYNDVTLDELNNRINETTQFNRDILKVKMKSFKDNGGM